VIFVDPLRFGGSSLSLVNLGKAQVQCRSSPTLSTPNMLTGANGPNGVFYKTISTLWHISRTNSHGRPQKFFQGGNIDNLLSFSGCWLFNASVRSQNSLHLLHHIENALCYGNSHKNCASFAAMLLFHSCFSSRSLTLRGLPLSTVTVSDSLHYLPIMSAFNSHMRQKNAFWTISFASHISWPAQVIFILPYFFDIAHDKNKSISLLETRSQISKLRSDLHTSKRLRKNSKKVFIVEFYASHFENMKAASKGNITITVMRYFVAIKQIKTIVNAIANLIM